MTAARRKLRLTRSELQLMNVLWNLKTASVRQVLDALPARERPAYTTVQTMLTRLEAKGAVRRVGAIGNAHIFEPAIEREAIEGRILGELLEMFGGSARPFVAHLLETGRLSLADLRELEEQLAKDPENPEGEP